MKEEKRILDVLGRGLLREFPNPERAGCPDATILKAIASHKLGLAEAERWFDHITSCSPCYRDFSQFQEAYQLRRKRTFLAVAASILVVASVAGWALAHRHGETQYAQTAVLDLRNRSVSRGTEPKPDEQPLEVNRRTSLLSVYLPLGSSEGTYDIRFVTHSGDSLLTTRGMAKLNKGITTLQAVVSLSSVPPGQYLLQIRKPGLEWNSYSLVVR